MYCVCVLCVYCTHIVCVCIVHALWAPHVGSTFPVVTPRRVEAVQEVVVVVLCEVHASGTILHHTFNLRGGSL